MGSKKVNTPPPIVVKGPTAEEIQAQQDAAAADMERARYDAALTQRRRSNITSMSRKYGFSGSGIFIPGGSD